MYSVILGPREMHSGVKDADGYRRFHAQFMRKKKRAGERVSVHDSAIELHGFIDGGRWLVVCECGSPNATDPRWGFALCCACGAVHDPVLFDEQWEEAERLLLMRPQQSLRNFHVGETVEGLAAENEELGL